MTRLKKFVKFLKRSRKLISQWFSPIACDEGGISIIS